MVKKISDLTYKIQKSPTSRKFNVNVNHLKSYLGENSPRPWVGPDGEPVPGVNLPSIPEDEPLEIEQPHDLSESQESNESQHFVESNIDFQPELSPLDHESIEFEVEPYVSPSRQSPVRTRVGRAVKPRQIYSP